MTRLLLVEDESRIVTFITRALKANGFAVDSAADGVQGLRMAATGRYDLMVVDLVLPGLDGVSVLRDTMRARPSQRVIVLSALADVETKVRCIDLGALDYLVKPVALAELVARIRSRLRQPAALPAKRMLDVGGFRLDLQRRVVITAGKTIPLSAREFLLLGHLMRKQGEVCGREELLDAVWGYRFDPGTNVVDVYVRRLRAKLGPNVIETVRNVGYCFAGS